jgi:hypothetical protein
VLKTLLAFNGINGASPAAGVVGGSDSALYGLTLAGGLDGGGALFRAVQPSVLAVAGATGRYGGTTTLTATLTSAGAPLAGRTIAFAVSGRTVGSAVTDDSGRAVLSDASLAGVDTGSYAKGISASFVELGFAPSTANARLAVTRGSPVVVWNGPPPIVYGTRLDDRQLNATANVRGSFTYRPPAGTILNAGAGQGLVAVFTPTDRVNYETATISIAIDVLKATPSIAWATPLDIVYGTALDRRQLNAVANAQGTYVYSPPAGTVLAAGAAQLLTVTFTPMAPANYTTATATAQVAITVLKATPVIRWNAPGDIVYGTPLGSRQLNATANARGRLQYAPPAGTVLAAGAAQPLTVLFTPDDLNNYAAVTRSITITVLTASPQQLEISPDPMVTDLGGFETIVAKALDAAHNAVPDAEVRWSVEPADVASISSTGPGTATIVPHAAGTAVLTARTMNGIAATVPLIVAAAAGRLLVFDSFGAPEGAPLVNHAPDFNDTAGAWTTSGEASVPSVRSGRAAVADGRGPLQLVVDSRVSDIDMSTDFRVGSGPGLGALAFRVVDAENLMLLQTYQNNLQLYRCQNGVWTLLASQALPPMTPDSTRRRRCAAGLLGWGVDARGRRTISADRDPSRALLGYRVRRHDDL